MSIHIRSADFTNDLNALHALTAELGYPSSYTIFEKRILDIHQDPNYHTWVATHDETVVGYIGFSLQKTWEFDGTFIRIHVLIVLEKFRKQSIAKLLLEHLEDFALKNEIHLILLNSGNRPEREAAHRFYLKKGFVIKSSSFRKLLYP